ncbi:hypothetical protein P8881_19800 [Bacillus haynesii]|uniref:hypothetical protein n=1 Tax=Bacillus haynesii TaxID=1925021 RepID=UPI00227DC05F|nr:hypothetical protein [Bacillus haynesii]MCY8737579.1 hypothetical protein [Bacillus haynesii]MEC0709772.1 hypothetical protein [Bacillus haynesii]MEC0736849.1 hypothetical protein [Bacillus haynesii]
MFFVVFKGGQHSEKSKLVFEKPLTFSNANEILATECERHHQTGTDAKFAYKIMDAETGDIVFNSKIQINKQTPSFFEIIKSNSNVPNKVVNYLEKIEKKEIVEIDEHLTSIHDSEARSNLENLKKEKNKVEEALKEQEHKSKEREIEFQRKMDQLAVEKASLEKIMKTKEKEASKQETVRIERLRELEEEAKKATDSMNKQRAIEKKSKEEYEQKLREFEEEANKAKNELKKVAAEYEKKQVERAKELKAIEEERKEAEREAQLLKAQMEKQELEHQAKKNELESKVKKEEPSHSNLPDDEVIIEEETDETEQQKKKAERKLRIGSTIAGTLNKSPKKDQTKKTFKSEETNLDEKLKKEKINFFKELENDLKKRQAEAAKKANIEKKYREELKKSRLRIPLYRKARYRLVGVLLAAVACIYIFNIDITTVTNDLKQNVEEFLSLVFKK